VGVTVKISSHVVKARDRGRISTVVVTSIVRCWPGVMRDLRNGMSIPAEILRATL